MFTFLSTPFPFGPFGVRFSVLSRELVKRQQQFSEQVAGIVQMPLGVIIAGDGPSELRSTLEKGMKHFEKERGRKRRPATLEVQQAILQSAAADYCVQMNMVREKREIEFVRQLLAIFVAQRAWLEDSLRLMRELAPDADHLLAALGEEKQKAEALRPALVQLRQRFEESVFAAERREQEADRLEKEAVRAKKDEKKHKRSKSMETVLTDTTDAPRPPTPLLQRVPRHLLVCE